MPMQVCKKWDVKCRHFDFMNGIREDYESHKKTIPVKISEVITVESAFSGRFKATHRIVGFKGDQK